MKNELPNFIIQAISDVVSQYIMEYDIKDKNIILRFSSFAESVFSYMQIGQEKLKETDIDKIKKDILIRKKLIKENLDLYKQLEHLESFHIPEHVIDSIVLSVNDMLKENNLSEIENRNFYCLFGENLVLDTRNYIQLHKSTKGN